MQPQVLARGVRPPAGSPHGAQLHYSAAARYDLLYPSNVTEGDDRLQVHFDAQLAATQAFVNEITGLCRQNLKQLTVGQFEEFPQRVVLRVCLLRQQEALLVGLDSMSRGLLHHAAAQVRQACDELIWLEYLGSLTPSQQFSAIIYLSGEEMGRALDAEAIFLGPQGMVDAGYPSDLAGGAPASDSKMRMLKSLQRSLGWPAGKRPPTTAWVAPKTEHSKLYHYLFSATSRFLHFSVSETMRRGWTDGPGAPNLDQVINLHSPGYAFYRADFAMYWLTYLYLFTAGAAIGMDGPYQAEPPVDFDDSNFQKALQDWKSVVRHVSIIRPDEFQVPPGRQGR